MNVYRTLFVGILAAFATAQPMAECRLRPYEARYETTVLGMAVQLQRGLKAVEQGEWLASGQAEKLFYRVAESSRYRMADGRVQPLEYRFDFSPGSKKDEHWVFDAQADTVRSLHADKPWELPWQAALLVQDRLSFQEQMSLSLLCQAQRPSRLTFAIPDEDDYDQEAWVVLGEEQVDTALGRVLALRLVHQGKGKRQDTVWLAPDWDYRPVKLRRTDKKGNSTDTRLLSLSFEGKPVKAVPAPAATGPMQGLLDGIPAATGR